MNLHDVIKRPLITEKAVQAQAHGTYAFEVERRATKPVIRRAVEKYFGVQVVDIRTTIVPAKSRRSHRARGQVSTSAPWKKALVTLAQGQTIEMFEGA